MALVKSGAVPDTGRDDAVNKQLNELGLSDASKALTVSNLDGDKKFKVRCARRPLRLMIASRRAVASRIPTATARRPRRGPAPRSR